MTVDAVTTLRRKVATTTPKLTETAQTALAQGRQATADRGVTPAAVEAPQSAAANAVTSPAVKPIDPERKDQIDTYVRQNASSSKDGYFWTTNHTGGDRIASALNGESELGTMTQQERRYMTSEAVKVFKGQGPSAEAENVSELINGVRGSENLRRDVAFGLASPAVEAVARGEEPDYRDTVLLNRATRFVNVRGVVDAFGGAGQEAALAKHLAAGNGLHFGEQRQVWSILADRSALPPDQAERLTTSMVLFQDGHPYLDNADIAQAIANVRRPGDAASDVAARDLIAGNVGRALTLNGGHEMIFGQKVDPSLRVWALDKIASSDVSLSAQQLDGGWESEFISKAYAERATDAYQARGTEPQLLAGESLRNTVGIALGQQPDKLPENVTDEWLAKGMDNEMFGDNPAIKNVVDSITEIAGDNPAITIVPVTITSEEGGAAVVPVFRMKDAETGVTRFVDHQGNKYEDFDHWQDKNTLPKGKMTYAEGLDLRSETLTHENTPGVIDSFGEYFSAGVKGVAIGLSLVGAGLLIAGTGGTATPLVMMAAGGTMMAAGDAEELYQMQRRGKDISDLSDPQVRSRVLGVASGILSVGAIGGGMRLAAMGARATPLMSRGVAALQISAEVTDVATMGDQAFQLYQGWDKMSAGQRAMGLAEIGFWGGMSMASVRSGGGQMRDGLSFTRLERQLRTGTPFEINRPAGMAAGEMHVAYDMRNGRPQNIRIEAGPGPLNPADIARHSTVARQMEQAGGLQDRLVRMVGPEQPPAGSAAWEARLEIDKITAEAGDIAQQLKRTDLTPNEAGALQMRQQELSAAIETQSTRLAAWGNAGTGAVAAPHRGAQQAEKLGYPAAPEGYTWVAGPGETPHLRDLTGGGKPLQYNKETNLFVPRQGAAPMRTVGNGSGLSNEAKWDRDAQGRLTQVEATLREYHVNAGRSADELAAQAQARAQGIDGDDAGHAVGHRFMLDQGLQNMFPQNANLNRGAYKTLENEMADWIAAGGEVKIRVDFDDFKGARPDAIDVRYVVTDPKTGRVVHRDAATFANDAQQTFERINRDRIQELMNQ